MRFEQFYGSPRSICLQTERVPRPPLSADLGRAPAAASCRWRFRRVTSERCPASRNVHVTFLVKKMAGQVRVGFANCGFHVMSAELNKDHFIQPLLCRYALYKAHERLTVKYRPSLLSVDGKLCVKKFIEGVVNEIESVCRTRNSVSVNRNGGDNNNGGMPLVRRRSSNFYAVNVRVIGDGKKKNYCCIAILQHNDGPAGPVKCHALTEYRREVAAFAVVFRPVAENSGGPFPSSPAIRYPNPSQGTGNTLVSLLVLCSISVNPLGSMFNSLDRAYFYETYAAYCIVDVTKTTRFLMKTMRARAGTRPIASADPLRTQTHLAVFAPLELLVSRSMRAHNFERVYEES
ncbi:hypothetical protein EVAR_883_1 [Eumeta japonica]|uniref:Uncharacterized protein n=1 Tax=Eumeta variegata TaxID=151549 RepID=A0A4C1SGP7_EUMVA|nr:hypothetical protein EVAR_883_1 [Eumeta japonica]